MSVEDGQSADVNDKGGLEDIMDKKKIPEFIRFANQLKEEAKEKGLQAEEVDTYYDESRRCLVIRVKRMKADVETEGVYEFLWWKFILSWIGDYFRGPNISIRELSESGEFDVEMRYDLLQPEELRYGLRPNEEMCSKKDDEDIDTQKYDAYLLSKALWDMGFRWEFLKACLADIVYWRLEKPAADFSEQEAQAILDRVSILERKAGIRSSTSRKMFICKEQNDYPAMVKLEVAINYTQFHGFFEKVLGIVDETARSTEEILSLPDGTERKACGVHRLGRYHTFRGFVPGYKEKD